jgi:hypothetical protein
MSVPSCFLSSVNVFERATGVGSPLAIPGRGAVAPLRGMLAESLARARVTTTN